MLPDDFDINELLSQASAMQAQVQAAQAELAAQTFTAETGGGLVTASVRGTGELVALEIKPDAVDLDDLESLSDLIIAAVRSAQSEVATKAQAAMPQLPQMPF